MVAGVFGAGRILIADHVTGPTHNEVQLIDSIALEQDILLEQARNVDLATVDVPRPPGLCFTICLLNSTNETNTRL